MGSPQTGRYRAEDVHRQASGQWPFILSALGVDDLYLVNRHGPCPICGGKDRFRFDDKGGKGTFYCNDCGAGDGFSLLQKLNGWSFIETLKTVAGQLGMDDKREYTRTAPVPVKREEPMIAELTRRVKDVLRVTCDPLDVAECAAYLNKRRLLPLKTAWRGIASLDYFESGEGKTIKFTGRFAALVATIVDVDGERVSAHITYLDNDGNKAPVSSPKKILSPLKGRIGCCVRLMPAEGDAMGIAEGIESALSAAELFKIPVWAALNTSLMEKWVPPPHIKRVVIFADTDTPGLMAAWKLSKELEGRVTVDMESPTKKDTDWNDYLRENKA